MRANAVRRKSNINVQRKKKAVKRSGARNVVMRILEGPEQASLLTALAGRGATDLAGVESAVRRIVKDVRRNGDRALRLYATRWDGLRKNDPLRVPEDELHRAWEQTDPELQEAIEYAAGNIRRYAEWQTPRMELGMGLGLVMLGLVITSGCARSSPASASASWSARWSR